MNNKGRYHNDYSPRYQDRTFLRAVKAAPPPYVPLVFRSL